MDKELTKKMKHPRGIKVTETKGSSIDIETSAEICGLTDATFATRILINQSLSTGHPSLSEAHKAELALGLMDGIRPKDAIEGMLATQMIALHNLAMECARRTMLEGQTFEGREINLRHANKLMNTFSNMVNTLDKHRGKGQQKITVEHQHINIESGGQAIVGDVRHGGGPNENNE